MTEEIIEVTINDPTWEDIPKDAIEISVDVDFVVIK